MRICENIVRGSANDLLDVAQLALLIVQRYDAKSSMIEAVRVAAKDAMLHPKKVYALEERPDVSGVFSLYEAGNASDYVADQQALPQYMESSWGSESGTRIWDVSAEDSVLENLHHDYVKGIQHQIDKKKMTLESLITQINTLLSPESATTDKSGRRRIRAIAIRVILTLCQELLKPVARDRIKPLEPEWLSETAVKIRSADRFAATGSTMEIDASVSHRPEEEFVMMEIIPIISHRPKMEFAQVIHDPETAEDSGVLHEAVAAESPVVIQEGDGGVPDSELATPLPKSSINEQFAKVVMHHHETAEDSGVLYEAVVAESSVMIREGNGGVPEAELATPVAKFAKVVIHDPKTAEDSGVLHKAVVAEPPVVIREGLLRDVGVPDTELATPVAKSSINEDDCMGSLDCDFFQSWPLHINGDRLTAQQKVFWVQSLLLELGYHRDLVRRMNKYPGDAAYIARAALSFKGFTDCYIPYNVWRRHKKMFIACLQAKPVEKLRSTDLQAVHPFTKNSFQVTEIGDVASVYFSKGHNCLTMYPSRFKLPDIPGIEPKSGPDNCMHCGTIKTYQTQSGISKTQMRPVTL